MKASAGGPAMSAQPELAPGTELMHFRIESLLGKGASSAVYRAENTLLGEAVALKVVASFESDHPLLGAYRDEYKAQLSITNKAHILHIEAPLLCAHQDLTWLMLPMELARESLRDWKKRHPVGEEQRLEQGLELFDQACDGVHALHEQGLVHLDIKPENILLTGSEDSPVVKVADFGLSRSMSRQDQRGSLFGDGIGTPAYMAPEQILAARWKDVGKEADIYALGMILYELLDGDLPYSGSAEQIKAKKRDASITISPPQGSALLGEAAMACLVRERDKRPKTAQTVMELVDQKLKQKKAHEKKRNKARALVEQAEQEIKRGEFENSLKLLTEADRLDPGNDAILKLLDQVMGKIALEDEKKRKANQESQKRKQDQLRKKRQKKKRLKLLIGDMIFVCGGTFEMGSEEGYYSEKPMHLVELDDFYIGKYLVTQAQWKEVMGGKNPSCFKGNDRPVECVSWHDVQKFITKLNALTGKLYRLPTEAEWEYAAQGGQNSRGYKYSGSDKLNDVGWFEENSGGKTQPVGKKLPNKLGLYDMSGNVWEWCSDWYNSGYFNKSPLCNPQGPSSGEQRIRRGGYWAARADICRCTYRENYLNPAYGNNCLGFRLACSSDKNGDTT